MCNEDTIPAGRPTTTRFKAAGRWRICATLLLVAQVTSSSAEAQLPLNQWERHVIDAAKPWRSLFIDAADLDGDGDRDIVTGGWWYRNPGTSAGDWTRIPFGETLKNMAAVYDFDGDGDADVLGTGGRGSEANSTFVWARNDGTGKFDLLDNIEAARGDFLQGVAVGLLGFGNHPGVALSWHGADFGIQLLEIPDQPSTESWKWSRISDISQDEQLTAGQIDRREGIDLMMGTKWLRNDGSTWSVHVLSDASGFPDRNRLADMDQDGRLDVVVGYQAVNEPGKLAWYRQGDSPTQLWREFEIATVVGPMSVDVGDLDQDGDLDVVVGEHNYAQPEKAKLMVFENVGGATKWQPHVVHTGDEHHDGAVLVDIDGDGDLDIISIGWKEPEVWCYENLAMAR